MDTERASDAGQAASTVQVAGAAQRSSGGDARGPSNDGRSRWAVAPVGRDTWTRVGAAAAVFLFALLGLPVLLSPYFVDAMTQVAIYSIVALGLGVLVGRVGLYSLGQAAVLAFGAWTAARLLFATTLPYPVVLLAAGVITMVLGVVIGLPAIRLRGLYLALLTLMLAGAITVLLSSVNFPNGGHGFLGYNGSLVQTPPIRRPSIAGSDPAYLRYTVVVAALMFLLVLLHIRTRPGRCLGGHPSERAGRAGGGHQHDLLQALGVGAGVVRHGRGRRPARRQRPFPVLDRLSCPGFDHPAGGGADGGCLQPLGRCRGRAPPAVAAVPVQRLGHLERLDHDLVRHRGVAGSNHRAAWARRPSAEDLRRLGRFVRGSAHRAPPSQTQIS